MSVALYTGFFAAFAFSGFVAVVQAVLSATRPRQRRGVME